MFITSIDHFQNVKNYCDVHLRKMITEQAQILSTAHRMIDGRQGKIIKNVKGKIALTDYRHVLYHLGENNNHPSLYFLSHANHPVCVWARESVLNYKFSYNLFLAMLNEYEYRFNKKHKSASLSNDLRLPPRGLTKVEPTSFVVCHSDFQCVEVTTAYKEILRLKFREWSDSNRKVIHKESDATRKTVIKITWTNRPIPAYVDDETLDMIKTYSI